MRTLLPLALLLTGCGSDPAVGVWLLTMEPLLETDGDCTSEVSHNFSDAYTSEDGDYVEEQTTTESASYAFVQVAGTGDGNAVLMLGDDELVGTYNGTQWVFTTERSTTQDASDTHTSGYAFTQDEGSDRKLTVFFATQGDLASGRRRLETTETASFTESDTWNPTEVTEVGLNGQIPSGSYLVVEQEVPVDTGGATEVVEVPATNRGRSEECDAAECQLDVSESCLLIADFEGVRVDWSDDEPHRGDL